MDAAKVRWGQGGNAAARSRAFTPAATPDVTLEATPKVTWAMVTRALALGVTRKAVPRLAALAVLGALGAPALAEPPPQGTLSGLARAQLARHGTVSRHFWAPGFATTEVAGLRLAAGLAVGVRAPLRHAVGAAVAPAVVLHTGRASNLTLLRAEQGGALLVWQIRH